ncbi:hypothetical protein Q8A73_005692 [Channa argus]|nr:hypothetical protein Q8A73_005692 [Channa argus]
MYVRVKTNKTKLDPSAAPLLPGERGRAWIHGLPMRKRERESEKERERLSWTRRPYLPPPRLLDGRKRRELFRKVIRTFTHHLASPGDSPERRIVAWSSDSHVPPAIHVSDGHTDENIAVL